LSHRFWLCLPALAAAAFLATPAFAQTDLRITVPAAPGGAWDQTAHAIEHALLEAGGARSVAITNVPGGRGTTGLAEFVNRPEREPNRLIVMGLPLLAALARGKSAATLEQTTPIARLTTDYFAIAVPSESPIGAARDLAEALKADPAKITVGGGASGSVDHVLAALFARAAGADPAGLAYAPFFGVGEMLTALFEGRIAAAIASPRQLEEQVAAGRVRLLGISSRERVAGIEAATLIEQGLDLEMSNWRAVLGPAGLTADERAALTGAVETALRAPQWEASRSKKGWQPAYLSGEAFAAFLRREQARVAEALRSVGLAK
jgi:putative tricarboxylic transport membrane protein